MALRSSGSAARSLRRAFDAGWSGRRCAPLAGAPRHHGGAAAAGLPDRRHRPAARQHPGRSGERLRPDRRRGPGRRHPHPPRRQRARTARARARRPGGRRRTVRGRRLPAPDRPQPGRRGLVRTLGHRSRPAAGPAPSRPPTPPRRPGRRGGRRGPGRRAAPARTPTPVDRPYPPPGPTRAVPRRTWNGSRRPQRASESVRIRYVAADGRPAERELRAVQADAGLVRGTDATSAQLVSIPLSRVSSVGPPVRVDATRLSRCSRRRSEDFWSSASAWPEWVVSTCVPSHCRLPGGPRVVAQRDLPTARPSIASVATPSLHRDRRGIARERWPPSPTTITASPRRSGRTTDRRPVRWRPPVDPGRDKNPPGAVGRADA